MGRDIQIAPIDGQPKRCRIVLPGGTCRCADFGRSFPNIRIADEMLVVCATHAEWVKPSAKPRITPVGATWVDQSYIERNHPWRNDPTLLAAEELKRRARE